MSSVREVLKAARKRAQGLGLYPPPTKSPSVPRVSENVAIFKDYERGWTPMLNGIQAVVQEETVLSRAIGKLTMASPDTALDYRDMKFILSEKVIDVSTQGYSGIYGDILLRTALHACRAGADTIIELGSGWGGYLFKIWLNGGPERANYYACEYSENGRKCTSMLSEVAGDMSITSLFYDYHHPDYSSIPPAGKTFVYTSHSVEQIRTLPREVILGLLDRGDALEGLHLEPVGWQVRHQRGERLPAFSARHEARCRKYQYNENLWSLLLELQAEGRIRITTCIPDIVGMDYNPSTLIRWVKV
jgi:hypothetical protein